MTAYQLLTDAASEDDYFREATTIIPEAIREEFVRVPADLAYWGDAYARAVRTYLLAEHARKQAYARTRLLVREASVAAGQKMTEGDVDARVEVDPEYQEARLAEVEAEAAKVAAKTRFDAVAAKRDMVISVGAHLRAEMGPDSIGRRRDD